MSTLAESDVLAGLSLEVMNSVTDLVLIKDPNSKIVWANKAFLDYYGMSLDALKNTIDSAKSDHKDTIQYLHDDHFVVVNKKSLNIEAEAVTAADGNKKYFNTIKSPHIVDGKVKYIVIIAREVRDRTTVAKARVENIERYKNISTFEAFIRAMPSTVLMLDIKGRIIASSRNWDRTFGSELGILKVGDFFFNHYTDSHPLTSLYNKRDNDKVVTLKKHEMCLREGNIRKFDVHIAPWNYADDSIGGHIIKTYEVTEHCANEDEIVILNKRLQLALEASQVGVWDWYVKDDILIWDDQMHKLYGTSPVKFSGKVVDYFNALVPECVDEVNKAFEIATNETGVFDTEFQIRTPDGQLRHIKALAHVEKNSKDELERIVGVNWDITDDKILREKLKRSNEELTQFAYRTSHDLRAPLINIKGLAHCALEDCEGEDYAEVLLNLKKIVANSEKLESLITDLLELCKLDAANSATEVAIVDLESMVTETFQKFGNLAKSEHIELETNFTDCPRLVTNGYKLRQIMENLISNSIKYSKPGENNSYVRVKTKQENSNYYIEIEDNGIGIPEKHQNSVFSMFQRFHPDVSYGSGLGLYLVKKNIDLLCGKITFKSSEDGTAWQIILPYNGRCEL